MDDILASRQFANSPVLSGFLKFIVPETIEGRTNQLKEYTIGIEVMKKNPSFLSKNDAAVRINGVRLRKLLDDYYTQSNGSSTICIELPKGTDRPMFSVSDYPELHQINKGDVTEKLDSICILPFTGYTHEGGL